VSQTASDLRQMFEQGGSIADLDSKVFRHLVSLALAHIQTDEDLRVRLSEQVAAVGLAAVLGQSKDDVDLALASYELARWARRLLAKMWTAKSRQELADGLRLVERELRRDMVNRAGRDYACSMFAHACMRAADRADVKALDFIVTCIDRLGVEPRVLNN